jgi:hypothetical protein
LSRYLYEGEVECPHPPDTLSQIFKMRKGEGEQEMFY